MAAASDAMASLRAGCVAGIPWLSTDDMRRTYMAWRRADSNGRGLRRVRHPDDVSPHASRVGAGTEFGTQRSAATAQRGVPAMTAARRERLAAFAVTALVMFAILLPELHYVPIWDGRVYANCAMGAAAHGLAGLSMESLRCGGHPTQAYIGILALSQVFRSGDIAALHLTNIALGVIGLASVRVVLARLFPDPAHARQLDIVTLLCAVHPVMLSTLIQPNVDFGVYVFFFAALAALLSGRFGWAALAGVLLCFSKETGVLAYGVMAGLYVLFRALQSPGTVADRVRRVRPMWVTALPLVLFGAHVLWWNATHAQSAVWKHTWQQGTLDGFRFFDLSDPTFVSYAAGIFVIGFMWVVTALIAADLCWGGVRMARRLPNRDVPGADMARLAYVAALTLVLAYLLTSFRTWTNLRYFALLYPLLMILGYAAIVRLAIPRRTATAILCVAGLLFVVSIRHSVDPVSRRIYGTFSTGGRDMYRMASLTGEYAGPGRDELVYNLQFTGYHHVQNALFRALQPTDSTAFATARAVNWQLWSQLDGRTRDRTLREDGVIVPRYWDDVDLLASPRRPHDVWYLDFTCRPDRDTSMASLKSLYREAGVTRASAGGHVIVAHHLELIAP
jgi:hypothetical protein